MVLDAQALAALLKTLPPLQEKVVRLFYGFGCRRSHSACEIAREFEVSPQGEWIDLDIDLANPHHEDGWVWNSGFAVAARIDLAKKIWYGVMGIPFAALDDRSSAAGKTFRINLFRSQGPPPNRIHVLWRPTMSDTFHVPEHFGLLRLTKERTK